MKTLGTRRPGRLKTVVLTAGVALAIGLAPSEVQSCGGSGIPAFCGKTLVLTKTGPGTVLVAGGAAPTVTVAYTVYFNLLSWGQPSICPLPPYPAVIMIDITCVGGPGLPAPVMTPPIPLSPGFNPGSITAVLPPGPPRVCTISGNVTVGPLSDGMVLGANGDSVVCIVEPSPDDPSKARFSIERLTEGIQHAHPGDQITNVYRLSNNDPIHAATVQINAELENVSRLPEMLGAAGPPGSGVYAVSDPGTGDNFPVSFDDGLAPAGCVYLPGDPSDQQLSTAVKTLTLPPDTTIDVPIHSRSWGGCANGSCSEGRVAIGGTFDNGDPVLACSSFAHVVDTSAAPGYGWPGTGSVIKTDPLDEFTVALHGQPEPDTALQLNSTNFPAAALVNEQPPAGINAVLANFQGINNEVARYRYTLHLAKPAGPGSQGSFAWRTQYAPANFGKVLIDGIEHGAPTGFETSAPFAIVNVLQAEFKPFALGIFDVMYQLSGEARDTGSSQTVPVELVELSLTSEIPTQVEGAIQFKIPESAAEGPPVNYDAIDIFVDVRGFSHSVSDSDLDGLPDNADNCAVDQNGPTAPDAGGNVQLDTDGDGIGNLCDPDIAPPVNDCRINFLDLSAIQDAFFSTPAAPNWNPDADLDGNGIVNFDDLQGFRERFFGEPGPSGVANICS